MFETTNHNHNPVTTYKLTPWPIEVGTLSSLNPILFSDMFRLVCERLV